MSLMLNVNTRQGLRSLFSSMFLYGLGVSILQVFVPIYFFDSGIPIHWILAFYAFVNVARLAVVPGMGFLACTWGAKKTLTLALFIQALAYLTVPLVQGVDGYFFLASALQGAGYGAWVSYHIHFSKVTQQLRRGKELSLMNILTTLASVLGPAIGGYFISQSGFLGTAIWVGTLILVAAMVLLKAPELSEVRPYNLRPRLLKKVWPDLVGNGFFNFQFLVAGAAWPLYIFLIVPSYFSLGLIQAASSLASMLSFRASGQMVDNMPPKSLLFWSSIVNTLVSGGRIFAFDIPSVGLANVASAVSNAFHSLSWMVLFFKHLDEEPRAEYCVVFEIGACLIAATAIGALALLCTVLPLNLALLAALVTSALAGLVSNLVRK